MMKIELKSAKCRIEMDNYVRGSVLKGTVKAGVSEMRTFLSFETDAPQDRIALLVRNAKQGCYAEQMIVEPVPLKSFVEVNGKSLKLEGITAD